MSTTTTPDSPETTIEEAVMDNPVASESADKHEHSHDHGHSHNADPAGAACGPLCGCGNRYYTELNRIVAGLFVGVLALMTFLLTVGFQRPHADFSWALYASIITFGLNLVAYVAAHLLRHHPAIKVVRGVQQVLFVVAVVAITCLALATAHFFFAINPAASTGAAPQ